MNCGTSTFILNGTAIQEVFNSSPFYNLTINKSSFYTLLLSNATVNATLSFVQGQIYTNQFILMQPASGTVLGAAQNTGWVNGRFRKNIATGATTKTFEIGDASNYTPLNLVFSNVTVAGNLVASVTTGDHPQISSSSINSSKNVNRYWSLADDGIAFSSYGVTLNFVSSDVDAGATPSAFKVAINDGVSWSLPAVASPNMTNIQAIGVTTFGDFIIGENCNAGTVISYDNSPYCTNLGSAVVTLVGTGGGTFSSNAGLSVNASTGTVNLSASIGGDYVVTYTISANAGCAAYFTTGNITVTTAPLASIAYSNDSLCSSAEVAAITLIGTAGGVYSAPSGLNLDPVSGSVNLLTSTPDTYTITYAIDAANGCAAYSTATDLTIITQPFATGTYEGNPYCSNAGIAFPTGSAVGLAGTLTSGLGLSIDPATGVVDLAASTPGTYTVTYIVPPYGGCPAYSNTATLAITAAPFATFSYDGSPYMLNQGIATVTFSGTVGGIYSSTPGLTLDPSTGNVTLVSSTPATYTVTYTVPEADGCEEFATMTGITVIFNLKTWDGGATTTTWGDANNWNPDGVPSSLDDVDLLGAYTINVNTAATAHDLTLDHTGLTVTINSGNSLALDGDLTLTAGTLNTGNSGSENLTLAGNWTNNGGTFISNANTVGFVGTASQTIGGTSPTTFYNISLANTASPGISIESNQNMAGVLTMAGNTIFDADGTTDTAVFTLFSLADNPTLDAGIGILPAGAQVLGNVTVQRFMSKEGTNFRMYRYLSSPVQNSPVSDLQNEIPITGPFTGTSICSACLSNSSMFYYDESVLTDINATGIADYNDGYIRFPNAVNTETMQQGRGYAVFVRGNILASTLWDVRGAINAGNVTAISHPVSFTSSGNSLNDGWNLVGNPFPSTIDWNAASGWTKTNIDGSIYTTDNANGNTQYATWNGIVGTNGGARHIAMGQGFWVKANSSNPILQSAEGIKAPGIQTTFFRQESENNLMRITLSNGSLRDETVIHFRKDANPSFDASADAWKLKNTSFNLGSLTDSNELLAINSWSELLCSTTIKLSVTEMSEGSYTLKFTDVSSFGEGVQLVLKDSYLNTSFAITEDALYTFSVIADKNSSGQERFAIQFNKPNPSIPIREKDSTLSIDYTGEIQWYLNGSPIEGAEQPSILRESNGAYSVIVQYKGCKLIGSTAPLITVLESEFPVSVSVFPNPVSNDVFVEMHDNNVRSITLESMVGVTLSEMRFSNTDFSQKVSFPMSGFSTGVYLLKISSGEKTYVKKIFKN